LNPEGVAAGNSKTSLVGKSLFHRFIYYDDELIL
jgi:hypothetical protein